MTYADTEREAGRRFRDAGDALRDDLARRGACAFPARLVRGVAGAVAREAAWGLDDAGLLSVVASRPSLLDLDERAPAGWVSPRDALREALAAALLDGLAHDIDLAARPHPGAPGPDEAAGHALRSLDLLAAQGRRYPLLDEAHVAFGAGDWDGPAGALALHACAFLADHGHEGPALDLEAALDAREDPAPPATPGPR